jgi:hypothetical protein
VVKKLIRQCIPAKTVSISTREPCYITPVAKSLLIKRNRFRRRGRVDEADLLADKINLIVASVQNNLLKKLSKSSPKQVWGAVHSCTSYHVQSSILAS